MEDIITKFRIERIKKGMSISDLAAKANVSTRTLCNMERYQAMPRHETIERIAKALDVDIKSSSYNEGKIDGSELLKAAQPLIELLRKKGNPMMIVQVTDERADLFSAECGTGK